MFQEGQPHILENLAADACRLNVHQIIVDKHATRRLGKAAYGGLNSVILEKVLRLQQVQTELLVERGEGLLVPVVADVGEATGKDYFAFLGTSSHHGFEEPRVLVVIVDDASGDDEIERVVVFWREVLKVIDVVFEELRVNSFLLGLLKHPWGYVQSDDDLKSSLGEFLSD